MTLSASPIENCSQACVHLNKTDDQTYITCETWIIMGIGKSVLVLITLPNRSIACMKV